MIENDLYYSNKIFSDDQITIGYLDWEFIMCESVINDLLENLKEKDNFCLVFTKVKNKLILEKYIIGNNNVKVLSDPDFVNNSEKELSDDTLILLAKYIDNEKYYLKDLDIISKSSNLLYGFYYDDVLDIFNSTGDYVRKFNFQKQRRKQK